MTAGVPIFHQITSTTTSVSSYNVVNSGATLLGSTLLLIVVDAGTPASNPISDSGSNIWTLQKQEGILYLYEAVNANVIADMGVVSFTNTVAGAMCLWLVELPGVQTSPDDGQNGNTGVSATINPGAITTTYANDTIFGVFYWGTTSSISYSNPPWTVVLEGIFAAGQSIAYIYQVVSATGSYDPTGTITSTGWDALDAAYKIAPVAHGGRVPNIPNVPVVATVGGIEEK